MADSIGEKRQGDSREPCPIQWVKKDRDIVGDLISCVKIDREIAGSLG